MKLVLATSNAGKVREIKALCEAFEVVPYSELIAPFEIVEDAPSFKENALIKARAVYEAGVRNKRLLVLSTVGRLTRLLTRVCPALYERIMARSLRSELER